MNISNVEIKASCKHPEKILKKLQELGALDQGVDHQIDSYFFCENGRLKLRQGQIENSLIFYQRKNVAGFKDSSIVLARIAKNESILSVLKASHGLKVEVDKKRNILFIQNAKFHLDEVKGLGSFVEIELIDEDGSHGREKLADKLQFYLEALDIKSHDFINVSYSDLILEKKFYNEAHYFLEEIEKSLISKSINLKLSAIDHLCYRVESHLQYQEMKKTLSEFGELLTESEVGNRMISTFKLIKAIKYKDAIVDIIELPAPKLGTLYGIGFEHAEFLTELSFNQFIKNNPQLDFDVRAISKKINPDLRINLSATMAIKLHHERLETIIARELI